MLPRGPFEVRMLFGMSSRLVGQGRRLVWRKSVGGNQKAPSLNMDMGRTVWGEDENTASYLL